MACNFNPLNPVQSLSDCTVSAGVDIYRMTGSWVLGSGNMTDQMWHATFDVVNKVAGVMSVITVMLGAASIVAAALRGRVGQAVAAVFRTLLAWPATVIVITFTVDALQVEGQVTSRILGWGGTNSIKADIDTNGLNIVFALLMGLVLWISALVLALSMGVRMFLIILGVGLSPAVVMVMPLSSMRQGLRKAAAWILGVILYRPLAAIIIYLTGNLFLTSGSNFMQLIMAVVGAFLAAFAPWMLTAAASRFLPIGVEGLTAVASASRQTVGKARSAADKAAATVAAVATGGVSLAGGAAALKSGKTAAASTAGQEPQAKGASASPTGASSDASPTQQAEGKDGSRKQGSKTQAETAPSSSSSSGLRRAAQADGLGDTVTRVGRAPGVYGTRLGTALQAAGSMVNALGGAPLTQMGVATNSTGSTPANPGPGVSPDTVSTSNAPAGGPGQPGRPGQPGEPGQPGTDGHTPNGNMQAGGQAAGETTITTSQTTNQTTVTTNQTSSAPTTPAAASAAGQRVSVDVRTHPDGRRE